MRVFSAIGKPRVSLVRSETDSAGGSPPPGRSGG